MTWWLVPIFVGAVGVGFFALAVLLALGERRTSAMTAGMQWMMETYLDQAQKTRETDR